MRYYDGVTIFVGALGTILVAMLGVLTIGMSVAFYTAYQDGKACKERTGYYSCPLKSTEQTIHIKEGKNE